MKTRKFILTAISMMVTTSIALAALLPGRWWVQANPNTAYEETNLSLTQGFANKGKVTCSPVGGKPSAVIFTFSSQSWYAKDYNRTQFSVTAAVPVSVNPVTGNLDVGSFPSSSSRGEEFSSGSAFVRIRVMTLVNLIVTGADTKNVTIRVSFQQVVFYMNWDFISMSWLTVNNYRSAIPYFATATSQYEIQP